MLKPTLHGESRCRACADGHLKAPVNIPDFEYAIPGGANYGECERCGSFTQAPMPDGARLSRDNNEGCRCFFVLFYAITSPHIRSSSSGTSKQWVAGATGEGIRIARQIYQT